MYMRSGRSSILDGYVELKTKTANAAHYHQPMQRGPSQIRPFLFIQIIPTQSWTEILCQPINCQCKHNSILDGDVELKIKTANAAHYRPPSSWSTCVICEHTCSYFHVHAEWKELNLGRIC